MSFTQFAVDCRIRPCGELGWFRIGYTDPNPLADGDVRGAFVPFLHLPDGSLVGFWFRSRAPAVCLLDHDGEGVMVANSWPAFHRLLRRGKTGVPDLDARLVERPGATEHHLAKGGAFEDWLSERQYKPEAVDPLAAERIRRAIVSDLRKRGILRSRHDIATLVVTLNSRRFDVRWYAGGLKPYPGGSALRAPLEEFRAVLKRSLKQSEFSAWGDGRMFFEKRTEFEPRRRRRPSDEANLALEPLTRSREPTPK